MRSVLGHLASIGVAVALTALCINWMVRESAVRLSDVTDDNVLTVEQCVNTGASSEPIETALIEAGVIDEDLPGTKVTKSMCEEILGRAQDGTPARKLVAAQNYVQEIQLIEGAMRRAADETVATRTDRHFAGFAPPTKMHLVSRETLESSAPGEWPRLQAQAATQTIESAAEGQYGPGGGNGGTGVVATSTKQAATIAGAGQKYGDASIGERLAEKEAAGERAGAGHSEAAAGARCSLEAELYGRTVKLLPGKVEIRPSIPREMGYEEEKKVELLVSGTTGRLFQKLGRQYEKVNETSESDVRCMAVTRFMEATLFSPTLDIEPLPGDPVKLIRPNQETEWRWYITGNPKDDNPLILRLSQKIKAGKEAEELSSIEQVLFDGTLTVSAGPLQTLSNLFTKNWQWLGTTLIAFIGVATPLFLWWRSRRDRPPPNEPPGDDEHGDEDWI